MEVIAMAILGGAFGAIEALERGGGEGPEDRDPEERPLL